MALRIGLTIPTMPVSGVGTSVGILHAGLNAAGHNAEILVTGSQLGGDFQRAVREGWCMRAVGPELRFLPDRLKRTIDCLSEYDVVINNSSFETQMMLPCLASDVLRIAVVRNPNRSSFEQAAWNSDCLDTGVGVSREMVRQLAAWPRMKCAIELIPNCTSLTGGGGLALKTPICVAYVGRLAEKDKNVLMVPDVLSHLAKKGIRYRCRIAGEGEAAKRLAKQCARQGVLGDVQFLGAVSRVEAADVLRTSHFCLLPSRYEGLSNVMLESMAVGCVPIASNATDFDWVLGDMASDLSGPVDDAPGYAERVASLVASPGRYRQVQEYLRERQQTLFTPAATIRAYLELIERVGKGRERRRYDQVPFREVEIPPSHKKYCTSGWRILQRLRDACGM